jgi:hypothetical protein
MVKASLILLAACLGVVCAQAPKVTVYEPKNLPTVVGPTFKYSYKNGQGAFQAWNGGLELPKVIDLGGVRVTRPILRGRKH